MSDASAHAPRFGSGGSDPNHLGRRSGAEESQAPGRGTGGPSPKRIIAGYGFWIFILSDIIMFAAFFAGYAVLHGGTADGPTSKQIFDIGNTAVETACLLLSSFACGMASLALLARKPLAFYVAMAITFLLGAAFLLLEIREFAGLVAQGAGPTRSAFLTAFFTLVGCHGLHVTIGLMWLLTMIAQVFTKGFRPDIMRRTMCFALFWHALDIIWVAVFTIVYLMGVIV